MSFGASASHNQTQSQASTQYDPALTGLLTQRAADATKAMAQNPYQAYSGQPMSFDSSGLQDLSQFQAPQISAASYNPSTINRGDISNISAGQLASTDLSPYLNKYTSGVIDTTNAAMSRQNAIDNTNAAAQATAAGAFGGSRSAILQNQNTDSYQRNMGQLDAQLNSQNFTNAQQSAFTDIGNRLQADTSNQGVDYNVANSNAGYRNQAGQFNATNAQQAALANQAAMLQGGQLRLGAQSLDSQNQQALYNSRYQQYLNAQQYPFLQQQSLNQSYGLLPTSPLSTSSSSGSGSSIGYQAGTGGK